MTDARKPEAPFWEAKHLEEMTPQEWEALCDGCGKCCLVLLEDEDTGQVWETDVACRLFDASCRRCRDYENRHEQVPTCVKLSPHTVETLSWMPDTCAYRLLAEGKPLHDWHPLISGTRQSVVSAGVAVAPDLLSEEAVAADELEMHILRRR